METRMYTVTIVANSVKTFEDVEAVSELEAVKAVIAARPNIFPEKKDLEYLGGNGTQGFYKYDHAVIAASIP